MQEKILYELKEKRTPKHKHFLNKDGTFTAYVYDEDIHYLKNNKFEEINNKLIYKNNHYENTANNYKVSFSDKTNHNLLELTTNTKKIKIGLKNYLKEKKAFTNSRLKKENILNDEINYKDILPNIDLKYEVLPSKIKETIILNNKDSLKENIIFMIETEELDIIAENDTLSFKDLEKEYFKISKSFMIDNKGEKNFNVKYQLINNNELKLILDEEWLNNEERAFPVIIDPSIEINTGIDNSMQKMIYSPSGPTTFADDALRTGVGKYGSQNYTFRSLIKFNLPEIKAGDQIISAEMILVSPEDIYSLIREYRYPVTVYRINTDWNETTATWANMSNNYDNRIEAYSMYHVLPTEAFSNHFDITNLVKSWYDGTPNQGLMIKALEEHYTEDKTDMKFYSKYFDINNPQGPAPRLIINYRNQNGIENYLSYQEQSFTNIKSYVNNNNGNLTTIYNIINTKSNKLPVSLNWVYNTNDKDTNLGFGNGARLNLQQSLEIISNDKVKYIDEDGTAHYFNRYQTEIYNTENPIFKEYLEDEDGLSLKLEKIYNEWIMTDKDGNKSKFATMIENDQLCYLYEIEDTKDNKIQINYQNNKINTIVDADNEVIIISYYSNSIHFETIEKTIITSLENNNIISIEDNGSTTSLVYNSNKTIKKITDVNGKSIEYNYYPVLPYRVREIKEIGIDNTIGNTLSITYGFKTTTIKDNKNRYNTFTFNDYGNTVSTSDLKAQEDVKNSYGKSDDYYERMPYIHGSFPLQNKLSIDKTLIKSVNNLILDSSFENDTIHFTPIYNSEYHPELMICNTESRTGLKCLKINSIPNQSFSATFVKEINVLKNNYYTFSAYIKTLITNLGKIRIGLSYLIGNEEVKTYSKNINERNYERYSSTLFYPTEATSNLKLFIEFENDNQGIYYIDDMQLEEGEVSNLYNLVDNSDFSYGLSHWSQSAIDNEGNNIINNDEIITLPNEKKAYKIKSYPLHIKNIDTSLKTNGKKGDVYNLSFWYKNSGINTPENYYMEQNFAFFSFDFILLPDDEGYGFDPYPILFNYNSTEWQFISTTFRAPEDYEGIKLSFVSDCNANECLFTNVCIFKDLEGTIFGYDMENGNLTSTYSLNNQLKEFKYNNNNQIETSIDPKGNNLKYEYDLKIPDKLLKGISTTGISNEIIYNEDNLPIKSLITNRNNNIKIIPNAKYYIRLKGTKKYLKLNMLDRTITLVNNKDVYGKVLFNEVEPDKYTITGNIFNHYIYGINNKAKYGPNNTNNKYFEVIYNDNGTISIKLYENEKYLKVENDIIIVSDEFSEFYLEEDKKLLFIENKIEYTDSGKFIKNKINSLGNLTTFETDEITGLATSIKDPNETVTSYEYNLHKQITKVINNDHKVEYLYDTNHNLSTIIHGTKKYNFIYDEFLNNKEININGNKLVEKIYEPNNGNLSTITYGNNDQITYEYDSFDRISKLIKEDNTYTYKYDNQNNLKKIIDSDNTTYFEYDLGGRITEYRDNNLDIKYKYDINDNIIKKDIYEYEYNKENALIKMKFDNQELNYSYDELGRLISKNINNEYQTNYKYITIGNKTSELLMSLSNNGNTLSYTYDKLNNIKEIYENGILLHSYNYDIYNQLIQEFNYLRNIKIDYIYDNVGNILSKKEFDIDTNTLLNEDIYEYNNPNWEDQLTKFNNREITYDQIGNPITIGNHILTWINGRELKTYSNSNQNITYKYNMNGIRIEKNVNGNITKYILEGNRIIKEILPDNAEIKYIYDNNEIIGLLYNSEYYYFEKNAQNDIINLLDDEFNIVANYEYDSWGQIINITDNQNINIFSNSNHIGNINPFRYRSYYYDNETSLYYLNSRYYNPEWKRFINIDSFLVQNHNQLFGNNIYIYAHNNPLKYTDPSGYLFKSLIKSWINGVKNMVSNYRNPKMGTYENIFNKVCPPNDEPVKVTTKINGKIYNYNVTLKGTIAMDFGQNKNYDVNDSNALAQSMKSAVEEITGKHFEDRTLKGLGVEINLHYQAYKLIGFFSKDNFIYKGVKEANIGNFTEDGNAKIFETISIFGGM